MSGQDREKKFWNRIVEALWSAKNILNRIENGIGEGMPDSYTVIGGIPNWIELKAPIEPVRPTTRLFSGNHELTQGQRNWLLTHRQAGGRGWIAIETERHVMLIGARHADQVNDLPLNDLISIADFHATRPLQFGDWTRFRAILIDLELGIP